MPELLRLASSKRRTLEQTKEGGKKVENRVGGVKALTFEGREQWM